MIDKAHTGYERRGESWILVSLNGSPMKSILIPKEKIQVMIPSCTRNRGSAGRGR